VSFSFAIAAIATAANSAIGHVSIPSCSGTRYRATTAQEETIMKLHFFRKQLFLLLLLLLPAVSLFSRTLTCVTVVGALNSVAPCIKAI